MKPLKFSISLAAALVCALALPSCAAIAQTATAAKPRSRVAYTHALPGSTGTPLNASVLEVNYGPGESSRPHSHGCAVIGYVVSGAIRTQVKGQPELIVHPGEGFYEAPNGVHLISANASQTEPASFLAFFVCEGSKPLSTDVPSTTASEGK